MAVIKIASSRNVVGAIRYLTEEPSHDGVHARVGAVSTQAMTVSHARWEAVETLKRFDKMDAVQARLVIQSFSTDELNPDSQEDLDKANEIGHQTAQELFGETRQFIVVTQADNGKVHNHIVAVSPDMITGKSIRGEATSVRRTRGVSDAVIERYGVRNINAEVEHPFTDRRSMAEIKRAEAGKYVWKDDLKQRIAQAVEDPVVTDEAIFTDKMMTAYGVDVNFRGKGVSYKFTDEEGKTRIVRGSKLGTMYAKEGLDYGFADNISKQEQLATELNVRELEYSSSRGSETEERSHHRDEYIPEESGDDGGASERLANINRLIREQNDKREQEEELKREQRAERNARIIRQVPNSSKREREHGPEF